MTVREVKKLLDKYSDDDNVNIMCRVDDDWYNMRLLDIHKEYNSLSSTRPVKVEFEALNNLTIEEMFSKLGEMVQKAIDNNSKSLTNIAYGGR